jgi:hypothetical protein
MHGSTEAKRYEGTKEHRYKGIKSRSYERKAILFNDSNR